MKPFVVFILAFCLLYPVAMIASGWLLTVLHVPNLEQSAGQGIVTEQYYLIPFILIVLCASLAYFVSRVFFARKEASR
ncbi:hypothetical protein JOC54_000175 [Alkalihalobacillus xiaoxiensis]|uniref:Uncharacterized protein n=1 Tax=Shouchella xiaoxiensis TaxID=766895 RepID=A0ABS2SN48_9BACI|nr:hypothetical protein [Shouchella xiaoxiensis]MBM7836944.1 hypothetical protein [Shouchella xiaoxiensis]